ncbi:MAG: hypothetical protein U9R58_10225, partial [Chloroflexota bacterium]|nr:hypothetical protein [Chloroflexota bacterium]
MSNNGNIKDAGWSENEVLKDGLHYYHMALNAYTDPLLKQTLEADLIDGALIGREVEIGPDVVVEERAVILGKTRVLKGKVEAGAVVVDCVARVLAAREGSLLFQVEQLNEQTVTSQQGQLLTDVIFMDEEIVWKERVSLKMDTSPDDEIVLINGKHMTISELILLSHFEAPYQNGANVKLRQVLREQSLEELFRRTEILTRFEGNPILEPIPDHPWESKMVYNPGAIRLDGMTYIVYRAFGDDHISRLGLAWSRDGVRIDGRLPYPIFVPETSYELAEQEVLQTRPREKGGCEDPRLTLIEEQVYLTYSAYAEVLQIALASITKDDFSALPKSAEVGIASKWTRYGPVFPGQLDRNAILFPEKINGKYVLLHRPMTESQRDIAITFSDSLRVPWPYEFESIIQVRSGKWDTERVGAGAQVLRTRYGWLLIYHGVGIKRGQRTYMLGVVLLDLIDPRQVLYRSTDPIFVPTEDYELYGWAPNV